MLHHYCQLPTAGMLPTGWGSYARNYSRDGRHVMRLNSNALTGSLPPFWSNLVSNSELVDLSNNMLSGAFPADWFNATAAPGPSSTTFNAE